MDDDLKTLIMACAACLIIGAVIGMAVGKPVFINLEENQRQNLIEDCEKTTERTVTKLNRDHQRAIDDMFDRMTEVNGDLIEVNAECADDWQSIFRDYNSVVSRLPDDVNQMIQDINVNELC